MFHEHLNRMSILLLLGGVFYKCQLDLLGWWYCSLICILHDFISGSATKYCKLGTEIPNYNCEFVYFSFHLYQFLLHVFWNAARCCIHTQDCYILVGWLILYHYAMPTFVPNNFPCSEIYFIWYYYGHSYYFLIPIYMIHLFLSFYFLLIYAICEVIFLVCI